MSPQGKLTPRDAENWTRTTLPVLGDTIRLANGDPYTLDMPESLEEFTILLLARMPKSKHLDRIGESVTVKLPSPYTWQGLISKHGSIRRLLAAYWNGELMADAERLIEESLPKMEIVGFKPICLGP